MALVRKGSQYKQIEGVKYEKQLLEEAEKNAADGQVSLPEARNLWKMAQDGGKVTATELRTLKYILEKLKFTGPAKKFLQAEVDKIAEPKEDEEEKEAGEEAEKEEEPEKSKDDEEKTEEKKDDEEADKAKDDDSGEDMDEPAAEKKDEEMKPAEEEKEKEKEEDKKAEEPAVVSTEKTDEEKREEKKRQKESAERQKKAEKRKKQKEKKKAAKEEEAKERLKSGKPLPVKGKGKAKGKVIAPKAEPKKKEVDDIDDIEIDYVVPEVLEGMEDAFQAVKDRFTPPEPEDQKKEEEEDEDEEDKPKKRAKPKTSLLEEAEDSDDDEDEPKSKKKRKIMSRMSVAELKTLVKRPDVVEVWDTTSIDPKLLVYLKAYRNTCSVPRHWCSKRRYMAGKRGVEKPPFKLPEFIEATGISKIRQAIMDKIADQSLKAKNREKVHPKMGKLDIDYQVLHDAFFKFAKKPLLTKHSDMYYEGKEYEAKMMTKRPGQLSAAMKEALGMAEGAPPPWLINMQRYGPPPAYPGLKIPGLNAPIPTGAEYGYHPGGWGKPPVDEFGNPLYGDWRQDQAPVPTQPEDTTLWGEVEDFDDEEDDDDDGVGGAEKDGMATPMLGTQTPLIGSGNATPIMNRDGGTRSISGVSSITSGMDTPSGGSHTKSKRGGIASVSGISSASLTPTPQLFQVLEEQKARSSKGMFPSGQQYKMRGRGSATPLGGIGSSGTGTPIAGIGTPIGGIGTPHVGGIATPVGGIATPVGGIATPVGGIATPVGGIATPVGGIATPVGGIATPVGGVATPTGLPHGAPTPHGGADTPGPVTMSLNPNDVETEGILTADIIRQQLKQHEEAAAKAKLAAGQKEVEPRKAPIKEKKKKEKNKFKF